MGAPAEILQEIFTVIEGGQTIGEAAEIIQFPSDSGTKTYTALEQTYKSTNGVGLNYWVAAVAQGASALSAGALMVSVAIPEFMALAIPCLGIAVGTAWYNIDPDGWTNLANLLMEAGCTVKEKVVGFITEAGTMAFPPEALEILKNELCRFGVFDASKEWNNEQPESFELEEYIYSSTRTFPATLGQVMRTFYYTGVAYRNGFEEIIGFEVRNNPPSDLKVTSAADDDILHMLICSKENFGAGAFGFRTDTMAHSMSGISGTDSYTYDGKTVYYVYFHYDYSVVDNIGTNVINMNSGYLLLGQLAWIMQYGTFIGNVFEDVLQKGATYPLPDVDLGTMYPGWTPWEFPDIPGWIMPIILPVQYPALLPAVEPYQDPAQNPQADPDSEAEKGVDALQDPAVNPIIIIVPVVNPTPDPDPPVPEPDPIDPVVIIEPIDPVEPDPDPGTSPVIPVPSFPDSVGSNKLFTVYNPNSSQLDQLGGYLWDADLIDQLKRIWQEPLDGIISLSQIYCTPTTGSPHNIILGFLNSGVSAKVVTSQFKEIDCGTVTIPELKENATDYNPYTALHIYLPFIGITELDVNEFMGGSIGVKYKIDVYTGTCLAEVRMIRTRDVPNGGITYTFSGNCSQQIPLTSGNSLGVLSALLSAAGVALGIASGGAVGAVAAGGAAATAHELRSAATVANEASGVLSREMLHVSHSGNLSANAGILGQKKPYVIISRQNPYNANAYNRMYGYPCNKTVYLGNCSGYTRVKAGRLYVPATQDEKNEILEYLYGGVIM